MAQDKVLIRRSGHQVIDELDATDIPALAYDATGTAAAAVSTHAGLSDPHPGYLTPAEGNAAYDAIGAAFSAVSTHAGLSDPHPTYTTAAELAAYAQPIDSDLTAVAALSSANDDVIQRKAGAWTNRTMAQVIADLATLGTTFQPLDADLTSIAALTTTTFGRSLLTPADAAAARALLGVSAMSQIAIAQTPTVSTSPAYSIADALGGLLTFANAALSSGGSGTVVGVTVMSKTQALIPALELVLFNQTFTAIADNAAFNPSDGDMANCIGVIPLSNWADYSLNSIATRFGLGFPYTLTGTSLFGQLVTRTAFTAGGTTDFIVSVQVARD